MKCSLCGKTALEKIEEQARSSISGNNFSMKIDTDLAGVALCDDCKEVLRQTVPAILVEIGIAKWVGDKCVLKQRTNPLLAEK
jgi:hypothetical protein